jgi:CBS domain-containing membrane protein
MSGLRVRDLMSERVLTVLPSDHLVAVRDLMERHSIRHVPVVDGEGRLLGLVTHRDLLRYGMVEQADVPTSVADEVLERIEVADVMTVQPATVSPETELHRAASLMLRKKYGCLPVVAKGQLVGILTESDFVRMACAVN